MATTLTELLAHCDALLEPARFRDYCPNGLQVEGRERVARLACAVTANQSVLDAAVAWEADLLLVHHGYFWRGEAEPVVRMKRRRLATLLAADMSLVAYHLPLDAHPEIGNNARFGALLGGDNAPIWDLHAGVGFLAAAARHGVPRPLVLSESSPVAAAAARRNLPDATVHVGATAERTLGSHRLPAEATVLLDPPRSGLSRRLGNQLLERRPRCIVMMSCNVATWARDTKRLQEGGYEISHLELFDLFPMTHHVEVLSVLVR